MLELKIILIVFTVLILLSIPIYGYYIYLNMFKGAKYKFKLPFIEYLKIIPAFSKINVFYQALMFASFYKDKLSSSKLFYYDRFNVDISKAILQGFIKLKKADIKVTINDILNYQLKGGDIVEVVPFMIKANNIEVEINLSDLVYVRLSGGKPSEVVDIIVKSKAVGHELTIPTIKKHLDNAGDFSDLEYYLKFIEERIKVIDKKDVGDKTNIESTDNQNGEANNITDVTLKHIRKYRATRNDISKLYEILKRLDNNDIIIDFDELLSYPSDLDIYEAIDIYIKLKHVGENILLVDIYKHLSTRSDFKELIDIKIKSTMAGVEISLNDLRAYPADGNLKHAVDLYIKAQNQKVSIEFNSLKSFHIAGGNIEKLVTALIKLKHEKLEINDKDLKQYFSLGGELEVAIDLLIKVKKVEKAIELKDLIDFLLQGGNINDFISAIIKSKQEDLGISKDDLMSYFRAGGNVLNLTEAFRISKRQNFDIPKEKLIALQKTGADVLTYVKALRFNQREKIGVESDILETHLKEGIDILKVLYAKYNLKNSGDDENYEHLIAIERSDRDVSDDVRKALTPRVLKTNDIHLVSQDGILLNLKANITVLRKNLRQIFDGAQEKEVLSRIEEALIHEVMELKKYSDIVENRNEIAKKTLEAINSQTGLNKNSTIKVIEITIPEISLNKDIITDLVKTVALEQKEIDGIDAERRELLTDVAEKEAHIKLIQEQADKEKNIGLAFKEGNMNPNEYYKYKANEK